MVWSRSSTDRQSMGNESVALPFRGACHGKACPRTVTAHQAAALPAMPGAHVDDRCFSRTWWLWTQDIWVLDVRSYPGNRHSLWPAPIERGRLDWGWAEATDVIAAAMRGLLGVCISTCRLSARIMPIRANIVGPPSVATSISASIAACHSGVNS